MQLKFFVAFLATFLIVMVGCGGGSNDNRGGISIEQTSGGVTSGDAEGDRETPHEEEADDQADEGETADEGEANSEADEGETAGEGQEEEDEQADEEAHGEEGEQASTDQPGTEEFGLTQKGLVQVIDKVEQLIAECMRKQGFKYIAADVRTVRNGMNADKQVGNLSEEEFTEMYGFGVSTLYTGQPPQLVEGYSPARVGLGEQNIQIFEGLSPQDQVAYNRALFGENADASLAVALETENLSRCGGCTMEAIKQVFPPETLKADFYNPLDALVNRHWLMKRALREYREEMRNAGFSYQHPDEVEPDIRARLDEITGGGTTPIETLPPEKKAALDTLRAYEVKVAKIHLQFATNIFDPIEERIHKGIFAGQVK